jgi:hypothetical protein
MIDLYALISGPIVLDLELGDFLPTLFSHWSIDLQSLSFSDIVHHNPRIWIIDCRAQSGYVSVVWSCLMVKVSEIALA